MIVELIIESKLNNQSTLVWTCHKRRSCFWKFYVKNAWFKKIIIQKRRRFWKKCHHFSTATKTLQKQNFVAVEREFWTDFKKLWWAHTKSTLGCSPMSKKKIEEEKKKHWPEGAELQMRSHLFEPVLCSSWFWKAPLVPLLTLNK